jgi:hypothetical protein
MSFGSILSVAGGRGLRRESIVPGQEFAVLSCEDVVCHCCYGEASSQAFAEGEHEGGLAGADRSSQVSPLPLTLPHGSSMAGSFIQ